MNDVNNFSFCDVNNRSLNDDSQLRLHNLSQN